MKQWFTALFVAAIVLSARATNLPNVNAGIALDQEQRPHRSFGGVST